MEVALPASHKLPPPVVPAKGTRVHIERLTEWGEFKQDDRVIVFLPIKHRWPRGTKPTFFFSCYARNMDTDKDWIEVYFVVGGTRMTRALPIRKVLRQPTSR